MARFKSLLLQSVSLAALAGGTAVAQEAPRAPVTQLDAVTVTATRNETTIGNVPATVTVIDSKEIDERNVNNIRDLIRYEPGVSVGNSPQRTGSGSYVIRGIGENRVLVTVDGVRVPDFPANSQPGTYFRDYVDLENVKRVEIVRGPASSLYGSDAIGGVVAYITKDPADYLNLFNKNWYTGLKSGYSSADSSFSETATLAARNGDVDMLLLLTRRDGHETENNGSREANPQDYSVNNALGKLVYHVSPVDQVRLTVEAVERNTDTDFRSDVGPVTGAVVTASKANDHTVRRRVSVDHVHSAQVGFVDSIRWQVAYQDVDRNEHSDQSRLVGGTSQRLRVTDQDFGQEIYSVDLQLQSNFNIASLPNRLTYGFDVDFTQTSRPRDRTEFNLTAGTSTKTVAGESFPTKVFPDTDTLLGGAYVQDEITALDERLSIIPAARVDYYKMTPHSDFAFERNNNAGPVGEVSAAEVSPKLGALYRLTDTYSIFGQYAHGFRSPPYDDANIGFTNTAAQYRILPNPDLEPETSDGFEAGVRGAFKDGSSFSITGFYTLYKNFIENRQVGVEAGTNFLLFQSINLDKVTIYGAEAKGRWQFHPRVSLLGAVAYARGEDEQTGNPVDSVDPLKGVLGLRYDDPDNWGAELIGTAVAPHNRVSNPTLFKAPGYGTLDLIGFWNFNPNLSLNVGLFNLLDKKYWIAQDTVGVAANSSQLELYTQPGTTFAVNAVVRW
jgi:hemoglobin/transferrin/lactoferrin receptor protein